MENLKAQVTVEYLLVFALSLSLISISIFVLMNVKDGSDKSIRLSKLRSMADDFADKSDTLCSLGNGARLGFATDEKLETRRNVFTFGSEISGKSVCSFHDNYFFQHGNFVMENFYGEIMLEEVKD
ncbi:MAG: hypothetical protein ABII22_03915 [Candidatus Micrarchaeota archaeon]